MATPPLDKEGFLLQLEDWNEDVARQLALCESLELDAARWELIMLTRRYYQQYKLSPAMRPLVKYAGAELGAEKGTSMYFLQLFPGSPAKLLSKLAGLPKPDNCL